MPNIREYNARNVDIRPDERGMQALGREAGALGNVADAQASLGRSAAGTAQAKAEGLANIGKQLGSVVADVGGMYVKYRTNQQVSRGAADLAGIQLDLTQKWNDAARGTDPNDTTLAPQFHEKALEPVIEKFVEGFDTEEGKAWAQNQTAQLREHFYNKTSADMATRAGMAATQNFMVLGNRAAALARLDPTTIPDVINGLQQNIGTILASNPNLSPEMADKLRTTLGQGMINDTVIAGLEGAIELNPDAGLAAVKSGKYADYLTGDATRQLETYAEVIRNRREVDAKQEKIIAATARKEEAKAATTQLQASTINPETGALQFSPEYNKAAFELAKKYGADFDLDAAIRYGDWVTTQMANPTKIVTDPYIYTDFAGRAYLEPTDPRKLTMAEVQRAASSGRLAPEQLRHFADIVGREVKPEERAEGRQFKGFLDGYKRTFTTSNDLLGNVDTTGDQAWSQFEINAYRLYGSMKAQQKPDNEIHQAIIATIPKFVAAKGQAAGGVMPYILPPEGQHLAPGAKPLGAAPKGPAVGTVVRGYRYKGGDPSQQASWEKQ